MKKIRFVNMALVALVLASLIQVAGSLSAYFGGANPQPVGTRAASNYDIKKIAGDIRFLAGEADSGPEIYTMEPSGSQISLQGVFANVNNRGSSLAIVRVDEGDDFPVAIGAKIEAAGILDSVGADYIVVRQNGKKMKIELAEFDPGEPASNFPGEFPNNRMRQQTPFSGNPAFDGKMPGRGPAPNIMRKGNIKHIEPGNKMPGPPMRKDNIKSRQAVPVPMPMPTPSPMKLK